MKHLLILFLLFSCSSSSNLSDAKKCKVFELEVASKWTVDIKHNVSFTSRTFIDSIETVFNDCIIQKDTSYLFKVFGKCYQLEAPMFGKLNKDYNLWATFEFQISTKIDVVEPNIALCYGIDHSGFARCTRLIGLVTKVMN